MAVAKHTHSTINSKSVDYIEVDISATGVEILSLYNADPTKKVRKELDLSDKLGINGTFFDDGTFVTCGITWGGRLRVPRSEWCNKSRFQTGDVCLLPSEQW
ncbi:hypothetical protein [Gorillibacterium timonense]|uniref:hypothetical protein n=1 Tax=Gorillibacterium timonense TaxID=1689269 RepID=UPI00071C86DF|nr:hypothetical protein [Gorillibacterium timonense]